MSRLFFAVFLACLLFLPDPTKAADKEIKAPSWVWDKGASFLTRRGNPEGVYLDLEHIYVSLYNLGLMTYKTHALDKGESVLEVLQDEGLVHGQYFPSGIDSVVCDMNPEHCSRELKAANEETIDSTTHIGGYERSIGQWTVHEGDVIRIPDWRIKSVLDFAISVKPKDKSASALIAERGVSCDKKFGADCLEVTRALNARRPPDQLSAGTTSRIVLPYKRLQIDVMPEAKAGDAYVDPKYLLEDPIYLDNQRFSDKWTSVIRDKVKTNTITTFRDHQFRGLISHGLPGVKVEASEHLNEPDYSKQESLLGLISHPLAKSEDLPMRFRHSVVIGVVDNWADVEHCDLKYKIANTNVSGGSNRARAGQCGTRKQKLSKRWDHGTHVAGLIAAGINGKAIVGLNPYAKLAYHHASELKLGDPRESLEAAINILRTVWNAQVVNMSLSYELPAGEDHIEKLIRENFMAKLVVTSAGNTNTVFKADSVCDKRPACFKFENVITVAGLNRDLENPSLWSESATVGSNSGLRMNIAAIAEDVLSIGEGDYVGSFAGTSQAAPQVAAAASLLVSDYETSRKTDGLPLQPIRIKNRLMYTADVSPQLLGSVFSGRLNVERALNVEKDVVTIKLDGEDTLKTYEGTISPFGVTPGHDVEKCINDPSEGCRKTEIICNYKKPNEKLISFKTLRRLVKLKGSSYYAVYFNEAEGKPLERFVRCRLNTLSAKVRFDIEDGPPKEFRIGQIRDFVRAMY